MTTTAQNYVAVFGEAPRRPPLAQCPHCRHTLPTPTVQQVLEQMLQQLAAVSGQVTS